MKKIVLIFMACLLVSCNHSSTNNINETANPIVDNNIVENLEPVEDDLINEVEDIIVEEEEMVEEIIEEIIVERVPIAYESSYNMTPYEATAYTPNVFENALKYDDIVNPDDYQNFSQGQIDMLNKNGFVVLQPKVQPNFKMHAAYELFQYNETPIFISSDIILHMYHEFYSGSMKCFEISVYIPQLKSLIGGITLNALDAYSNADDTMKEDLMYVTAYFGVPATLLNIEVDYPEAVQELIDQETSKIEMESGVHHNQILDRDTDYSQYLVRGHYNLSDDFKAYFKAMMWLSQAGFDLNHEDVHKRAEARSKSLLIASLIYDENLELMNNYSTVYDLTSLYSGTSDDLNIYDMNEIIGQVFGASYKFSDFRDDTYEEALDDAINEHAHAKVIAQNGHSGVEFRFIGQRYTLDAEVMQNLVDPYLRAESNAFDFAGLFNEKAEKILRDHYPTNEKWPEFDDQFQLMKEHVEKFDGWQDDLYHGWLWAIEATLKDTTSNKNYPMFMQNDAWAHKNIAAALGSFTELKHDNVLYSKQVMAECGGESLRFELHHYVEPNVELYTRLKWLTENTLNNINTAETLMNESYNTSEIEMMIEFLDVCQRVSIKELQGEEVSQGEMKELDFIGGIIDRISSSYLEMLYQSVPEVSEVHTSALISDIATVNGQVSEVATGLPMPIYVMCDVNGEAYLTKGVVFSFYDFKSDERLTDETWQEKLGFRRGYDDYGFLSTTHTGETLNILEYMPWMKSYISPDENLVEVEEKEVSW